MHLQRIQRHAKTDEDAARVIGEFAALPAHARQIISRYDWAHYVLRNQHL